MGKLILGHARSVVATTTRPLWSYLIDAIKVFILNVLLPQEALPCKRDLSFVKNVKGKLSMKVLGI